MKSLSEYVNESLEDSVDNVNENNENVFEGKVESESDFRDYAEKKLKAAFGDDYDADKANSTIDGIVKKADGDWEAALGMIVSGLKEDGEVAG